MFPAQQQAMCITISQENQSMCQLLKEICRKSMIKYSLGPAYEFVCISFRTDNLNCFRAS